MLENYKEVLIKQHPQPMLRDDYDSAAVLLKETVKYGYTEFFLIYKVSVLSPEWSGYQRWAEMENSAPNSVFRGKVFPKFHL